MCFSAGASFASSAVLGVVGLLAVRKTATAAQVMFAGIPLLFAAQQFTEGLVWLSLSNPDYSAWQDRCAHGFLFFAQVVWPVWGPLALLLLEENPGRKKPLVALTGIGLLVALYLAWHLAVNPVRASISAHHILYEEDFPMARLWFGALFYVIPTALPFFISSVKYMWILGLFLLASYLITHIFYAEYLTSVWCYFAAILSIQVVFIVQGAGKEHARRTRMEVRAGTGR